jgi:hypothetical protein
MPDLPLDVLRQGAFAGGVFDQDHPADADHPALAVAGSYLHPGIEMDDVLSGGAMPINVVFSLSRKSPGASLSVPVKHEPIDLFGDGVVLVNRIARGPQRGHPLLEIVVG